MKGIKTRLFLLALLLSVSFPFNASPEEPSGEFFRKESPIEITADSLSYDKETDTYFGSGSVVIVQEGTTLKTDAALLDMTAGVATASGSVEVVDEGGNALRGENLQMNIREKTAVIAKGRIFYKQQNIHITGDPIKKTGPEDYEARHATYTACDCPEGKKPAWHFSATSAKITIGEFLTGWNGLFYIKGVPVLYSPFIVVPVKKDRQTGFLQPRPGFSKLRGFIFDEAFFWAISKNTDATFYLDLQTSRGIGEAVEYRYIRTRRSSGRFYFHHFEEKDIGRVREFRKGAANLSRPKDATNNRWRLQYVHNEVLPENINLRANINLVSDDEYFIDFGKGTKERSLESIESNVSISKNWSVYSLVGQFRVFKNLLAEDNISTLQRLPEVTFTGADQKIYNSPFYFSSQSSYVNFYRKAGLMGERLDTHPRISLPLHPGGYFEVTPSAGARGTFYLVKHDPVKPNESLRYADRYLYDLNLDITTTFIRIFHTEFETLKAIRHSIRPKLTYTYIPEAVQGDLPQFDAVDNVPATNALTYSLNTIITGKRAEDGVKSYIDYTFFEISQTYNINEATRRLNSPADKRRPFSDITGELIIRPANWATARGKSAYDMYNKRFNSYDASLGAADKRGDSLNWSYRFLRGSPSYTEVSARGRVVKPVDVTFLRRASLGEHKSLETTYGIEYKSQCWSAVFTYTERLEEKVVYLTFNLLGLGRVAGFQGRVEPM